LWRGQRCWAAEEAAWYAPRRSRRLRGRTVDVRREVGVAELPGVARGGDAAAVLDRAVGAVLEQDTRGLAVVVVGGVVQRRVLRTLVRRVHVAAALDEGRDRRGPVVEVGHLHQHRPPVAVAVLHLGLAAPAEHLEEVRLGPNTVIVVGRLVQPV